MTRTAGIAISMAIALSLVLAGCDAGGKSGSSAEKPEPGTEAPAQAEEPAASMIDSPTFADPFDGTVSVPGQISAAVVAESNYEGQWGPVTRPNPTATEADGVLLVDEVTDYKAYDPAMLDPAQGTFEMQFTPAPDILETFTLAARPEWVSFGDYDPPGNGALLDTIGWRAAPQGSYQMWAGFTEETATVSWGIWDGSAWHYVNWTESPWTTRPYRITASYGPAGVKLYVDGEMAAEDPTYADGIDTSQPVALGQAPWYWPYGPHSLLGEIREFKYSTTQY